MNFFRNKIITINPDEKIKEGFLKKQSRFRKVWRERWVVLTTSFIYTFEKREVYKNPDETIDIKKIKIIKTDEANKETNFVS